MAKELFHDKLFDKYCMYSSALLKKSSRVFKNSLLNMPHALVELTTEYSDDPLSPEYD